MRTRFFCAIAAALVTALPAAAQGLPPFDPARMQPASEQGVYAPALRGNWILSGYGHYYRVRSGSVDIYSHAGGRCWYDAAASAEANQFIGWYARSWWWFDTAIAGAPDTMQYHIDPLITLPQACTRPLDRTTPAYTFDAIASLFIEYFPYAAKRGVDFVQRRNTLRPLAAAARDDAELAAVVAEFIGGFDDPHTGVNAIIDGETVEIGQQRGGQTIALIGERFAQSGEPDMNAWLARWNADQNARIDALLDPATRQRSPDGAIAWGVLDGNVGYLAFDTMLFFEGTDAANRQHANEALDSALTALASTRALVLDVSINGGGLAGVSADIAGRFADRRRLAYTKQAPGVRRAAPHPFHVAPSGTVRYDKPVALLTADLTTSAGELFTLMMRTLPKVTHVGAATQGAVSGAFPHGLPNGWQVGFPTEVTRDARGRVYEVTGIPPAVAFDVFPRVSLEAGRTEAIRRAAQIAVTR
jgi:hypothetical protein